MTPSAPIYDVAIVGGGLAGLTTAYGLIKKGIKNIAVFEARDRWGGRAYTHYYDKDSWVELGGERIRRSHTTLINLCAELGVQLKEDQFSDFWIVDQQRLYQGNQSHAFIQQISDSAQTTGLDTAITVITYLERMLPDPEHRRIFQAFLIRKGFPSQHLDQPLNPSDKASIDREFKNFTAYQTNLSTLAKAIPDNENSIREYKIKGGNFKLVQALLQSIQKELYLNHTLKRLSRTHEETYLLEFQTTQVVAKQVVLALPLTVLRDVNLEKSLEIPELTQRAIKQIIYNTHKKIVILHASASPWTGKRIYGMDFDRRASFGVSEKAHLKAIVFYFNQTDPFDGTLNTINAAFLEDLLLFYRGKAQLTPDPTREIIGYNWAADPYAKGSYADWQLNTWLGNEDLLINSSKNPARKAFGDSINDSLFFAGEHTQSDESYLNSAVLSGQQVAAEIMQKWR